MSQPETTLAPRTAGNENTSLIKILAIALMIVDHVGAAFFKWPASVELRFFGRIAFPLFAWCMAVGAEYTRNIWKYLLRLLIVGVIAQPCYMQALHHEWHELNVYATLFFGMAGIAGVRVRKFGSQIWGPILALIAPLLIKMDYGILGVFLVLGLYACRKSKGAIACFFSAFCLFWGISSGTVITTIFGVEIPRTLPATVAINSIFGISLPHAINLSLYISGFWNAIRYLQFWAILALPLMLIPMGKRFKAPQWIWYAAYPGHLLVIGAIRHWPEIRLFLERLFGQGT